MTFYTYIHRRESDNAIFYVGKGQHKRAWAHEGRNKYWRHVVAKHGRTVEICAKWPTAAEAYEHEKILIACFKDLGCDLCNMTDGGDGPLGYKHSEEAIVKICVASKAKKLSPEHAGKLRLGRKSMDMTDEYKAKLSAAKKGIALSDEHRTKLSTANKGKPKSEETKAKLSTANKGKPKSDEHKAKLSAASKASWAAKKAAQQTNKSLEKEIA